MKTLIPAVLLTLLIFAIAPRGAAQSVGSTAGAVAENAGQEALTARTQAVAQAAATRDQAAAQVTAAQDQVKSKLKLPFKLPKFEVPDVFRAAKIRSA